MTIRETKEQATATANLMDVLEDTFSPDTQIAECVGMVKCVRFFVNKEPVGMVKAGFVHFLDGSKWEPV